MRITLMNHGTRGDVEPLVALADELRSRGHDIRMAVPVNTTEFVSKAGFNVVALPGDSQALLGSPECKEALSTGKASDFMKLMRAAGKSSSTETSEVAVTAAKDADLIIAGPLMEDRAVNLAEALKVPTVLLHTFPMRANSVVANALVTGRSLPLPGFNLATHSLYERAVWKARIETVNIFRSTLGLPATNVGTSKRAEDLDLLELQNYSPSVIGGMRWPQRRPLVGWMQLTTQTRVRLDESGLSSELDAWIADGRKPVYVGFGSMPVADGAEMSAMIERAAQTSGERFVVNAGWAGLSGAASSANVFYVDAVDHSSLLPRCSMAIHHGGSGTTGASIRAGIPTFICSVLLDQAMWGQRVERLGVGAHVPMSRLTGNILCSSIAKLSRPSIIANAAALGERVKAEPDATVTAADQVEARVDGFVRSN